VWLVGLLALSVYLYYRPLASYFGTRNDLAAQQASLVGLSDQKAELQHRLVSATSTQATQREARRIGFVRPGEQLFIVKGIPAWRKAHHSLRGNG
jgi:Septum formation initiator